MVDNVDVLIVPDGTYFRVEFWIDDWKFHTAKMPKLQAKKLRCKFTVEEKTNV